MPVAMLVLVLLAAQQPADPAERDLAVIDARLGSCSADFTVTDENDEPVYAAIVHVRIRYGFLGIKRMDLEVGTNSDGEARVQGLPDNARPMTFDITKDEAKAIVEQDGDRECEAAYEVTLR